MTEKELIKDPVYIIDKVLEWFAMDVEGIIKEGDAQTRQSIEHLDAEKLIIKAFPELNSIYFTHESEMMMNKLYDDGYLYKEGNSKYTITFNGKMFNQQGGYSKKHEREINQANLQFWQTWAIVVGTFFAGLYGIIEVIRLLIRLCD